MDPLTQPRILLDVFLLAVLAICIGIPAFHQQRINQPHKPWNITGNIPAHHFTRLDLIGVSVSLLIFVTNIFIPFITPPAALERAVEMPSLIVIIAGVISQMIPVGIAMLFLATRMNVLELFGLKNVRWKKVFLTAFIGLLIIYAFIIAVSSIVEPLLKSLFGERENQVAVQMLLKAKSGDPALLAAMVFLTCVVAPVCEEIVFRGYLYGVLKRFSCPFFAAIFSGIIFAVIHGSLWALAPLIVVGIGLAVIYEISGSLWACILTHSAFNTVATVVMLSTPHVNDLPY